VGLIGGWFRKKGPRIGGPFRQSNVRRVNSANLSVVMPALVAGIHVFLAPRLRSRTWMAGTSPATT